MPVQILPALERFIAAAHAVETLFLSRWKSSSQGELSLPLDAPLQVSTRPCSERRVPRHSGYTGDAAGETHPSLLHHPLHHPRHAHSPGSVSVARCWLPGIDAGHMHIG